MYPVYPAIAESIDQDSSGFVSVHEVIFYHLIISLALIIVTQVNSFLKVRPSGWSVAQWIAL